MNLFPSRAAFALVLFAATFVRAQTSSGADTNVLKALRATLAEQQRHPDRIIHSATNAPASQAQPVDAPVFQPSPPPGGPVSTKAAAAAALERQYLEGKLSARQYQKALAELDRANKAPVVTASPKASTGPQPALEPVIPTAPPKQTEKQKKVSDVESKLDAMIKEKEARDRAAQTNAPAAPGPKATKRERLDFLLKQVVAGKLGDEEYKKEREKILAEPE